VYGVFAPAAIGEEKFVTLENELIKIILTTKGGRVYSVQLKDYLTYDSLPLILFDGDFNKFNLNFFAQNRNISTGDLYFKCNDTEAKVEGESSRSVSLVIPISSGQHIEYLYTLKGNSYDVKFDINVVGLDKIIASNSNYLDLEWNIDMRRQEKGLVDERNRSTIYYQYVAEEDIDYISETSDDQENLSNDLKWVAFKNKFFSSILIADNSFDNGIIETRTDENSQTIVKNTSAKLTIPYDHKPKESFGMMFYFGPNHYQTLETYNLGLENLVELGWAILRWVNIYAIIPVFNFLDGFNLNYGLIILILTILLKLVLFPITFKQYKSMARMKVLQPEIKEIQEKHKGDQSKIQQETMKMYQKTGVNPLGGCLPMVLQFPILIAMFYFFPTSIELRQQSFWWATDLSSYDSIYDFGFNIPFYGDHISLFTLLMSVTNIMYMKMNSQMQMSNNPQMKIMMYIMPVMFLGIFNDFPAALTYYYFLTNIVTILQQYVIKQYVDEDAIRAQLMDNKKKPVKKSAFQKRLEDMAKAKGYKGKK